MSKKVFLILVLLTLVFGQVEKPAVTFNERVYIPTYIPMPLTPREEKIQRTVQEIEASYGLPRGVCFIGDIACYVQKEELNAHIGLVLYGNLK